MRVQRVEPIRSQVARLLRQAIGELRFKPGQVIVERELCELTGASRPSVREALRQLESEGLVTSVVGKGTIVASVTPQEARQLYEVRGVLEGLACRLFVANASAEQTRQLTRAVDKFEAELDQPDRLLANKNDFYSTLFAGAGNEIAAQITTTLQRRTSFLRSTSLAADGRPGETLKELRAMLAAMNEGDAQQAERLCRDHVLRAQDAALSRLREWVG